jgi:hypothetical protein
MSKLILKTFQIDRGTAVQGNQRTVFIWKFDGLQSPSQFETAFLNHEINSRPSSQTSMNIEMRILTVPVPNVSIAIHWPSNYVTMFTIFLINNCNSEIRSSRTIDDYSYHFRDPENCFFLIQMKCSGSKTFYKGPDLNSHLWLTDPAPDHIFSVRGFQDTSKNNFFHIYIILQK